MRPTEPVWIVREPDDPIARQPPVHAALEELETALAGHGLPVRHAATIDQAPDGAMCVRVAGRQAGSARAILDAAGVSLPDVPEALALVSGRDGGRPVLLACGRDARGLAYAVLEVADRVAQSEEPSQSLAPIAPTIEQPANPIRSIARLFTSDLEDKPWFHDAEFWRRYLAMLMSQRFNRVSLTLGLGYNFPRRVRDAYLYFAYPFLLAVPGYDVHVPGLPAAERDRNLAMLRLISEEAKLRGLDFQLGLWTHAYEWIDSPDANFRIAGLTPENHAAYCRDALRALLEACPAIHGVTFRIHGESGIPERSYEFWRTVFDGIARCGREVEIDMHAKGIDQEMIEIALATGMPVNVSPKYWAEHMGLPYQQASIRELERPPREDESEGFMALSGGSRRFLRYGYGDLLTEDRRYGVLYRIWPGTQRFLLWGDPAMAAGYGRFAGFCGCLGLELCEPLSFKGRMGSGMPGGRDGYLDASLRPAGGDWEKYLYTYRLFGRLLYNPDADPESWRRFLRREFGDAAPDAEAALASASRVLPLVTTAHHPSASNNAYWPEIYTNMPIVDAAGETEGAQRHPYGDTPVPKRFGTVSSLDPELFSSVEEFADEFLTGRLSGRVSPLDVAQWLDRFSEAAERHLVAAEARADDPGTPLFRRLAIDTALQSGLGRFFARKLRAGVRYAIYERTGNSTALEAALSDYRAARDAWAELASRAEGVYARDLTYGLQPHLRGHWSDRLAAIDQDIQAMERLPAPGSRLPAGEDGGSDAERPAVILAGSRDSQGSRPADPRRRALARAAASDSGGRAGSRSAATIDHTPPTSFRRGEPLTIVVAVSGGEDRESSIAVRLHYRHVNQA
jgi:hypothetical protein